MMRSRHSRGVAAVLAAVLVGCTPAPAPTPQSRGLDRVEPALVELLGATSGMSAVLVDRDKVSAYAISEERLVSWSLDERPVPGPPVGQPYPVVPAQDVDAHTVAGSVRDVAGTCSDRPFEARVTLLASQLVVTEGFCEPAPGGPRPERPDALRVNGRPLEPFARTWRADEWARVRALVAAVSPQMRVVSVEVMGGDLGIEPATAAPASCRVNPRIALDGTRVRWMCLPATTQSDQDWSRLSDEDLTRALDDAASAAGIALGPETQIRVDARAAGWEVTVRDGARSASRELG